MTYDDMIEVIKAYRDGKEIEYRTHIDPKWCPATNPSWNFCAGIYRVKKKKMKVLWQWIISYGKDNPCQTTVSFYDSKEAVERSIGIGYIIHQKAEWTRIEVEDIQ